MAPVAPEAPDAPVVVPAIARAVPATALERAAKRLHHPAALTAEERARVLDLLCSPEFCDLSPPQVYFTLLDCDTYYCSIRTMVRMLEDHGLSGDRRRGGHQAPGKHKIPVVHASAPNMAWLWVITKLRGPNRGDIYFLYTILDIYSRFVVGWHLAERENATIAEHLFRKTAWINKLTIRTS